MDGIAEAFVGKSFHTVKRDSFQEPAAYDILLPGTLIRAKKYLFEENEGIIFKSEDQTYMLVHVQECCEDVWLEDITGDLDDLENSVIIKAEKRQSISNEYNESRKDRIEKQRDNNGLDDIYWTFYEIATNKGSVTLRFCGPDSYYSTDVDLIEVLEDGDSRKIMIDS